MHWLLLYLPPPSQSGKGQAMQKKDNQYQRKARYNPNRETYVDENGNYVYLIWDEELQD